MSLTKIMASASAVGQQVIATLERARREHWHETDTADELVTLFNQERRDFAEALEKMTQLVRRVVEQYSFTPSFKHVKKPDEHLWLYSMGKRFEVVAIFTEHAEANKYMATHDTTTCIAVFGPFIVLANKYTGIREEKP